ncbi:MAG: SDR family oxidoreductase [Robiginitomaculum sp.]
MSDFQFKDQIICITGAAGGIGYGLAQMFIAAGARVAISDRNAPHETAKSLNDKARGDKARAYACDVSDEDSVIAFIEAVRRDFGPIDIYCSNAGVGYGDGPGGYACGGSNKSWDVSWGVNVMGSVYAGRALFPTWRERGSGRFVITASAAGLLNQTSSASYSVTKHAAVGLAEAMAINHREDGIGVHCICPQYVRSNMTKGQDFAEQSKDGLLEPSDVANALAAAIKNEDFLVLSHPIVLEYYRSKGHDYNRWVSGMAKLKAKIAIFKMPLI